MPSSRWFVPEQNVAQAPTVLNPRFRRESVKNENVTDWLNSSQNKKAL